MVRLPTRSFTVALLSIMSPARAFSAATPSQMEATVRAYFQGVTDKDPVAIRNCFADVATIRDVCALSAGVGKSGASPANTVEADVLVQRCMDFVGAHPDCVVKFHYGPTMDRNSEWIVAHWYETGTWTGLSCGLEPNGQPMAVEGQTRFRVDPEASKIVEFVVTRTFTEWELAFLQQQEQASTKS
jgi:hypothetical protein